MARTLKVVHIGLGPIGQSIARLTLDRDGLQVVGATDLSVDQAGKDLGVVLGLGRKLRIKVDGNPDKFMRKTRADVAVLCTSSSLKAIKPQVLGLIQRGMHVVTTCEELAFPVPDQQAAWRDIDKAAAAKKVSVLATGVNPGYAMDALALMLTAPCAEVTRVSVTRVVDARTRRLPLQRKVGAGLNLNQFRRAMTEGTVRHVGLPQSVYMIASGAGLEAGPRGRDAGAGHRPARPRHRVPAHPRRHGRGHQAVGARLPQRRAGHHASTCRCTSGPSSPATTSSSTARPPST